ncbi:gfo/Idh/MocA family oxidoreductase [Gracilibacillus salitolerans]|uniref:Gfo/Idh/MocA family oxidoreductase n=1 Tax=Gracilibacillus salitolerans TaxID=2663022 RepID=A0A5Q2TRI3_9BACI|nr:Gfo/Idh/MocA family oxidoreductase [Gracilibacillus salitolerans]QGH36623.1 gfo/Idh/MocA family oxidoreductase [Gracilibacillus salitolerans]
MSKVRVGIVGLGSISDMHIQGYLKNQDAELFAVCDMNEARAKQTAEELGVTHYYTDYQEMLSNNEIDAVSICTWNNTHAEIAMAALNAGKNVLTEKPLCKTVEEALAIEEAVRNNPDQFLQIGYVRRFGTNTQVLKRFIDHGELGDIYFSKATCLRVLGNPGGWFADKERSGGGPLIDIGVHVIDLCWYLMGKPKVQSVSGNTYHKLGNRSNIEYKSFYKAADYDAKQNSVEDLANAIIRFENGASLMVDVSFSLHAKKEEIRVSLHGDKGGAEIEPQLEIFTEKNNIMLNSTPQIDHLTFDFAQGFQNEIDHFVNCVKGEEETIAPVEDGVEMMKILTGVYKSSKEKTEVRFD